MINIRIKTRFWSIVLFLPIFFIALNCSSYTNRITSFDSRKDQIRNQRMFELGWDVMRFWVYEVRDNLDESVNKVKLWLENKI